MAYSEQNRRRDVPIQSRNPKTGLDRSNKSVGQGKDACGRSYFDRSKDPRSIVMIVRAGRTSAFFLQSVCRAELGDIGDEVAGFRFRNEACFFGEEEHTFVDRG